MPQRALVVVLALLLLLSVDSALLFYTVTANPHMHDDLFGEKAPPGIVINEDGTISGTDKIIRGMDGTYTLAGDISESITIMRNGIVLDGDYHTLSAGGSNPGVFIKQANGITIRQIKFVNCLSGVKLAWQKYGDTDGRKVTIEHNTFSYLRNGILSSDHFDGGNITSNRFIGNSYAVSGISSMTFRGNKFDDNDYCITGYSQNDIDTSNTVNGKPIYYLVGEQDRTVPSDAGFVVLKQCSKITVQGLNLSRYGQGIIVYDSDRCLIKDNILNCINGIALHNSNDNAIVQNTVSGGNISGLTLSNSFNNSILENQISSCQRGIWVIGTDGNNTIVRNRIMANVEGIHLSKYSSLNTQSNESRTLVIGNVISKNGIGITIWGGSSNTIVYNDIKDNLDWGMLLEEDQQGNTISHNNFIGNNVTDKLQVCIIGFWKQASKGGTVNGSYQHPRRVFVSGMANAWNGSYAGNYWSDYSARFPNASEISSLGVWDTPYFINENNIDNHPLMAPIDINNINNKNFNWQAISKIDIENLGESSIIPSRKAPSVALPSSAAFYAIMAVVAAIIGLALFYCKHKTNWRNTNSAVK